MYFKHYLYSWFIALAFILQSCDCRVLRFEIKNEASPYKRGWSDPDPMKVPDFAEQKFSRLVLEDADSPFKDTGNYCCIISNSERTIRHVFLVKVEVPKILPRNPEIYWWKIRMSSCQRKVFKP